MKRASGTGTIFKLKGNRYKPYVAYVKTDLVFNEEKQTCYKKRKAIGYFETQKQAQAALEEYLKNPYDLELQSITFGEIWKKVYDKLDVSESRDVVYRTTYNKYFKSIDKIPLRELKSNQLQSIIDSCDQTSSVKTNIKTIMNKVYSYGLENDIINKDYTKFVKFKRDDTKVKRTLFTKEDVEIIKANIDAWDYAFMYILLYTGMRPKELIELKKENIKDGCFDIVESKTKAGIRTIPIHNELTELVNGLMAQKGEYLLTTDKGCKIQYQNFMARHLPKIQENLGCPHQPYECRHTFITRARECKMEQLCIQRIVGHKPTTITEQVYTHISINELKIELDKFHY